MTLSDVIVPLWVATSFGTIGIVALVSRFIDYAFPRCSCGKRRHR